MEIYFKVLSILVDVLKKTTKEEPIKSKRGLKFVNFVRAQVSRIMLKEWKEEVY